MATPSLHTSANRANDAPKLGNPQGGGAAPRRDLTGRHGYRRWPSSHAPDLSYTLSGSSTIFMQPHSHRNEYGSSTSPRESASLSAITRYPQLPTQIVDQSP